MDNAKARELGYIEGRRRTLLNALAHTMRELHDLTGDPNDIPEEAKLFKERQDVVATLRQLCTDYGDNDWKDYLHLSDVIEAHLIKHLVGT